MSPILANAEAPADIPPEVYEKAAELRALLAADLWEEEKARRIADFNCGDLEIQLAVGLLLTASERRAWHDYFTVGYGMRIRQD